MKLTPFQWLLIKVECDQAKRRCEKELRRWFVPKDKRCALKAKAAMCWDIVEKLSAYTFDDVSVICDGAKRMRAET